MFRSWLQDSCRPNTLRFLMPPGNVTSKLQPRLPNLSSVKFYTASLPMILAMLGFATISIAFWSEIHLRSRPCVSAYSDNRYLLHRLAHHFPVLSRYQTIKAPSSRSNAELDFKSIVDDNSHWIAKFLNKLCDSDDLADQLHYLRNLDVNTRALLQNTVFESEMLIAYIRICHTSGCTYCFGDASIRGVETCIPEAKVLLHHHFR